jgi:hypothetical protein
MTLKVINVSLCLLGAAASSAWAADAAPAAPTTPATAAAAAAVSNGPLLESRRVVRDKETGKLRSPTEEELAAERAERKARGEPEASARAPLAVRQHANGMRSAVLGPEYLVTLKAERGPDGRLVIKHADPAHDHPGAAQPAATK